MLQRTAIENCCFTTVLASNAPEMENYVKHLKHKKWSGIIVAGCLSVTAARNNSTERWKINIDCKTKQISSRDRFLQKKFVRRKSFLRLKALPVATRRHATHVWLMTEHYLRMQSHQGESHIVLT